MTTIAMADYTPPAPAFGTWTLVDDLLPPPREDVIVAVESDLDDELRLDFGWIDDHGVRMDDRGNPMRAIPTYWMPQPPLPKKGRAPRC